MTMRLFAAVAFDGESREKISGLYNLLRGAGVTGSFTRPENLHLTLKFLGETDSAQVKSITAALENAARDVTAFAIKPAECGFFSSRGSKTVWLGMEGNSLAALAEKVDASLAQTGFEREKRAFTPHVTLARKAFCNADMLESVTIPDFSYTVSAVTLFESRRDSGRLWYKPYFEAELKKK